MSNTLRKYHRLSFMRHQRDDICFGHMEIWLKREASEATAFDLVQTALTQWIGTTESGRKAYGDYEEFNFGDFLNSSPWDEKDFMKIARKHGITKLRGDSVDVAYTVEDWDGRLVDHEEIKIGWAEQGIEE